MLLRITLTKPLFRSIISCSKSLVSLTRPDIYRVYTRTLYFTTKANLLNCRKLQFRHCSSYREKNGSVSGNVPNSTTETGKLTRRQQLKFAVRDYGSTVIVFHVGISLLSLGVCYLAVDNGLDVSKLIANVGFSAEMVQSKIATGGSTFVIAYAVHKLFAPVRIFTTVTTAPIIVRYLRRIGVLKLPKASTISNSKTQTK